MPKDFKRYILFRTNKYQRRLIIPTVVACLAVLGVTFLLLEYYINSVVMEQGMNSQMLFATVMTVIATVTALLLGILIWSFYLTNKVVGPYSRVIQELDDVISGKKQGSVNARDGDEMFKDLLSRVNVIIERSHKS